MCNDYLATTFPTAPIWKLSARSKFPRLHQRVRRTWNRGMTSGPPRRPQSSDGPASVELSQLRWGFDPGRPKAPPVINFRSEGRRFANGRCLIPALHFYEFTGAKTPKSKWRFTMAGAAWFCFAGLWRSSEKGGDTFTILTTAPGPDVAPIHNRQVVVLPKADWMAWLDLTRPEASC